MSTTDGYDRPPYRVPAPPGRPGSWVVDVLLPWRLARRIYGPFGVFRFSVVDTVGLVGPYGQAVDPLIERLLLPRTLLGLGLLAFVVGLFTGDGLLEPVEQGFTSGLLMLGTGPVALLAACGLLVGLARPGARGTVLGLCARPLATALITAAFCGLFVYWAVNHFDGSPDDVGGLLLVLVLGPWLTVFFGSVLYLMNRNAFGVGGHPLVRPLAVVPLGWLTAIAGSVLVDSVEGYPGGSPTPSYWVAVFAGPVGVTVTALVEVVLLRRRHGVGFRGPLAGWRPPAPPRPPMPPMPPGPPPPRPGWRVTP
ncbi:hypothetical protein [Streptomyces mayteni]